MKIYCVLFDTMPFQSIVAETAAQKNAEILRQVGGCFTTTTLLEMFTGKMPSDLEKRGIGYHRHRRYIDPATGVAHWPWQQEMLMAHLLKNNWEVRVHNGNYFTSVIYDDERIVQSTAYPGGLEAQKTKTWDTAPFIFEPGPECTTYYERERSFINEIQSARGDRDVFHFIIYHPYHAAITHQVDKTLASNILIEMMSWWDLDEKNALFWFFSDHGDWTAMAEHPVPADYLSWVLFRNNIAASRPVPSTFISAVDFYPTIMDLCEYPYQAGDARSIYRDQDPDRLLFMEDGRARFDTDNSTTALVGRFVDWDKGMPGGLLQVSYFLPTEEFRCHRVTMGGHGFASAIDRMPAMDKSLAKALSQRFDWVTMSERMKKAQLVTKEYAQKRLNPHMAAFLPFDKQLAREEIDPVDLVTWMRFDVVAKYLYAQQRAMGVRSSWAIDLYHAHERAFNALNEKDGSGKQGIADFLNSFHETLDSVEREGFNDERSVVPVSCSNNLLDGSHRVAACLCYNKPVAALRFDFEGWHYGFDFFKKNGLAEKYGDAIAYEYCKLKKNTHVVLLFPSAQGRDNEVRAILLRYAAIVYEKRIVLKNRGPLLLMTQVYKDEDWLGSVGDNFSGAQLKARECFKGNDALRIFVIETLSPALLKKAKDEIRALYNIANHSVHINDTHAETLRIAQLLLNRNSIHFLNHAALADVPTFRQHYAAYRNLLDRSAPADGHYCITGSAVLALYGLRDAQDIDYLHFKDPLPGPPDPAISSHEKEEKYYPVHRDDIIFNPDNHFFFDGCKFASLDIVVRMKKTRGETKDIRDVQLARPLLEDRMKSPLVSIIILNYNGLKDIRLCLDSIIRNTPERHEVIVFDNASTDGSQEYLNTLRNITLVESPTNLGCPPGRAQAMSIAKGEYLIFLDNDTIVTPGWVAQFIRHAAGNPRVGMIGPRSNYVSGQQLVTDVAYDRVDDLDKFAVSFTDQHRDQLTPSVRLVGFCMFIRREVVDKIGSIDASFGKFGFEDDDYTWRAHIAGFQAAIANDVFIHHTGGPQGQGNQQYNRFLFDAWTLFKTKWGLPADLAYGSPFDLSAILSRPFDPGKHYLPLVSRSDIKTVTQEAPDSFMTGEDLPADSVGKQHVPGMVSIVLRAVPDLEIVKKCLHKIDKFTHTPHEVLFIAPIDMPLTVKWAKKTEKNKANFKLLEHPGDRSFAREEQPGHSRIRRRTHRSDGSRCDRNGELAFRHARMPEQLRTYRHRWTDDGQSIMPPAGHSDSPCTDR